MKLQGIGNALLPMLLSAAGTATAGDTALPNHSDVPGVVIDYRSAASRLYLGSPSIAILSDGSYVASHDFFGPKARDLSAATTAVFRSDDRGQTWKEAARIENAFWSNLFVHNGHLHLMGTTRGHGSIAIRRSDDGGYTWTTPKDAGSGLLTAKGAYHTAPMPVVTHRGRLWRGIEDAGGGKDWGTRYRAMMISAPVDADLLNRDCWTFSSFVNRDPRWMEGRFRAWLEGNAVVAPDGQMLNILRVQYGGPGGKAAIVRIRDEGTTATFDPTTDFVDFPGGAKKFTIRFDPQTNSYWSLVNPVMPVARLQQRRATSIRNTLALMHSTDLKHWQMRCILLYHPDVAKHGFQYPDWQFDGDDLITAIRTAYGDGQQGAHDFHDANYFTFHRFENFRELTMTDSVVDPQSLQLPPPTRITTDSMVIEGRGFTLKSMENGGRAFANRTYVWQQVPKSLRGWRFTQKMGGGVSQMSVSARCDGTITIATSVSNEGIDTSGWQEDPERRFCYTDSGRTSMRILHRAIKRGEQVQIPQGNWTGSLLLIPPDPKDEQGGDQQ